LRIVAL